MTLSPVSAPQGVQAPRVCSLPDYVSSAGEESVELARLGGLGLDPWQEFTLASSLGERPDGKWAAFEVGIVVPRQNGKGSILEARQLAGLFLLGERLQIYSAHQFDTSLEAFRRLLMLIEQTPEFDRRVKRVSKSHGEEGIELLNGQRIRFRTRTKGGGRGFTGDVLYLDEAMILPEAAHGALLPTLSARPNPQVIYSGSAVDELVHEHGRVLTRVRQRGMAGDPRLAYVEWSVDAEIDAAAEHANDPHAWATANPGLGIRISHEHVDAERRAMDPRTFAVERLGIGAWPSLDDEESGIDIAAWGECRDIESSALDPVVFAFDVQPDRSSATISTAGRRPDGRRHVETVDCRPGTGWVVPRLADLRDAHSPAAIICDAGGPAAALLLRAEKMGLEIQVTSTRQYAEACGGFYDAVEDRAVRHLGTPELLAAIKGAARRALGDAWAWSRKSSNVDITPLVSASLALWGVESNETEISIYQTRGLL